MRLFALGLMMAIGAAGQSVTLTAHPNEAKIEHCYLDAREYPCYPDRYTPAEAIPVSGLRHEDFSPPCIEGRIRKVSGHLYRCGHDGKWRKVRAK